MTHETQNRGATPIGYLSELGDIEAASVMYLRRWCSGPEHQATVWNDFAGGLGQVRGRKALKTFEDLCAMCLNHGRRPLMRHAISCKCVGTDEACFANFVATATEGDREDALLMAMLLVRADVAPIVTSLAMDFGLTLKLLHLRAHKETPKHPTLTHAYHPRLH